MKPIFVVVDTAERAPKIFQVVEDFKIVQAFETREEADSNCTEVNEKVIEYQPKG